jgi:predicted lipoprotein
VLENPLISRTPVVATALVLGCLATGGCKIVKTPIAQSRAAETSNSGDFDPNARVAAIWDTKLIPYLAAKAGDLPEVVRFARETPDEAGQKFGYRAKEGNQPWTFAVKLEGRILAAETMSRAATISVDNNGDGKVAAIVQIGPAMRGTALRDSLDFVSFNDFKNQIDFAQFGKAFNQYVAQSVLSKLPRDSLAGRKVTVLGAFTLESGDQPPFLTPAQLDVGPAP